MENGTTNENNDTIKRYYCYQCLQYITLNNQQAPTCSVCNEGFVEEIEESSHNLSQNSIEVIGDYESSDEDDEDIQHFVIGQSLPRNGSSSNNGPIGTILDQLLRDVLGGRLFGPPNVMTLHGNPGDYAWGANGLDSVITQLLNQLEGSGAPPATDNQVESLVNVNITKDEVSQSLQCSVCWENFSLHEKVKAMPCKHRYHNDCILPWLKLHGTCPICRKDMNLTDTSTREPDISLSNAANNFTLPIPGTSNTSVLNRNQEGQNQSIQMTDKSPE